MPLFGKKVSCFFLYHFCFKVKVFVYKVVLLLKIKNDNRNCSVVQNYDKIWMIVIKIQILAFMVCNAQTFHFVQKF